MAGCTLDNRYAIDLFYNVVGQLFVLQTGKIGLKFMAQSQQNLIYARMHRA